MFIGIVTLDIIIHGSSSLKDKRRVMQSLKVRLRKSFNVSVTEVDNQELWQRSTLGISLVATTESATRSIINSINDFMMRSADFEIINKQIDIYKPTSS